ncbi:MAG: hypothetical protein V4649_12310 [Bacteroidota bacterium]
MTDELKHIPLTGNTPKPNFAQQVMTEIKELKERISALETEIKILKTKKV